jgi:hypothetical protein
MNDILRKQTGYAFFSKLYKAMQYYTFALDDEPKSFATIVTPFGKRLVFILAKALFYGTVSFRKFTSV